MKEYLKAFATLFLGTFYLKHGFKMVKGSPKKTAVVGFKLNGPIPTWLMISLWVVVLQWLFPSPLTFVEMFCVLGVLNYETTYRYAMARLSTSLV